MKKSFRWAAWLAGLASLLLLSSCAKEPRLVGLSAVTFNFAPHFIAQIAVNGKLAGTTIPAAKPGKAGGGGGVWCCVRVPEHAKTVEVRVIDEEGDYTVIAPIMQPWPEIRSYFEINVLGERRIVVEVLASSNVAVDAPSRFAELLAVWESTR